ncbi:hypothetical protein BDQ17DRAFT_1433283 [Cyathus striatus]|nr:hypothetical protein BDQ17DRAFT_1433283 [Cyathus striatus]
MEGNAPLQDSSFEQHLLRRQCTSVFLLAIFAIDVITNFNKEYKYIWRTPPFFIKRVYICLRYIPLSGLISSVYSLFGPLTKPSAMESYCHMWFVFMATSPFICLVLFDMILLLRGKSFRTHLIRVSTNNSTVYALYNKHLQMGYFLVALFAVDTMRSGDRLLTYFQRLKFDAHCNAHVSGPYSVVKAVISGFVFMLTHTIIWGLTLRRKSLGKRLHIPLIQTASKDGSWAFAGITPIAAIFVPFTPRVMLAVSTEFVLICPMVLFSIIGCHIILNLQQNGGSPEYIQEDVELPEMASN